MRDALRRCENVFARYYLNQELEDVQFDFVLLDDIVIGEPFTWVNEMIGFIKGLNMIYYIVFRTQD